MPNQLTESGFSLKVIRNISSGVNRQIHVEITISETDLILTENCLKLAPGSIKSFDHFLTEAVGKYCGQGLEILQAGLRVVPKQVPNPKTGIPVNKRKIKQKKHYSTDESVLTQNTDMVEAPSVIVDQESSC